MYYFKKKLISKKKKKKKPRNYTKKWRTSLKNKIKSLPHTPDQYLEIEKENGRYHKISPEFNSEYHKLPPLKNRDITLYSTRNAKPLSKIIIDSLEFINGVLGCRISGC